MKMFLKAVGHALDGCFTALKIERSFKIQSGAMLLAVLVGIYVSLSPLEWGLIIICIGSVLTAELFNTALERLSNEISGGRLRSMVKQAKDISAGAVLISALTALVIGILFLIIPFIQKISDLISRT